jgi:hypothetical protein
MARAFFGLLVAAALGVTGYYTYSYVHNDGTCCHSDGVAVKSSCCQSQAAKSCCSESGECTGACSQIAAEAKCDGEKKEGCCEGKEGGCCKDKKEDGKKE